MADIMDKTALRRSLRQRRNTMSGVDRAAVRSALHRHAGDLLALPVQIRAIAGFQPTNGEPDVTELLRELSKQAPIVLPRVVQQHLEWVAATPTDLRTSTAGIPSPHGAAVATGADIVTQHGVGLMLVPALAIDPTSGARLGYGFGFYDRLLEPMPRGGVAVVGVCHDEELLSLPVEAHDQPVDWILTESGLHRCGQPPSR